MSPRGDVTVGDLAALVSRGVRLDAARVTATGIVARVSHARCLGAVLGARRALASSRLLAEVETSPRRAHLAALEAYVLGVLVDVEAADAVAEPEADETCPSCDGRGWLETTEGYQLPCELCDERGLVACDATSHAHEEAYASLALEGGAS